MKHQIHYEKRILCLDKGATIIIYKKEDDFFMIITDKKIRIYLYSLLYKKKILLLYSIIVMLLGTFLSLGFLWALKIIVDVAIPQRKMDVFFLGMVILIVLPILSTFLISAATMINTTIGGFVTDDLRKTMFNKIITFFPKLNERF